MSELEIKPVKRLNITDDSDFHRNLPCIQRNNGSTILLIGGTGTGKTTLLVNMLYNKNITFKELYEYSGIELVITTVRMTGWVVEDFSYKTHPDLSVLDATYMSSSLPFIIKPMKYNDSYYLDGEFLKNNNLYIYSPLPRRPNEMDISADNSKYQLSFKGVENSVFLRMALINKILTENS